MRGIKMMIYAIIGGLLLLLVLLACGVQNFGGIAPFVAYVNGEAIFIHPKTLDLGALEMGAETVAVFRMQNLTSKGISVVGEKSSCSCAFSEKIPISALPGETVDLKINIHLPKYDNAYDQTVIFMVAEPNRLAMHPVRILASIPNPLQRPASVTIDTETEENLTSHE